MKRTSFSLITFAAILIFAGGQVFAQHGRSGGAGMGPAGHPGGPGSMGGPGGMGGPGSMGGPGGMGSMGRPSSPGPDFGGTRTNSPTTHTAPNNRKSVSDLLTQNTKLSDNLKGLLPDGTDLGTASDGFKNLGQFVAAVHVSKNLGIPFDTLKGKITGKDSVSLGKAIHELDPTVNAKAETKKATKQAKQDLKSSKSSKSSKS